MLSSSKWAVIYFTCVDLGPDTNGGALCCRNHVIRLAADPAIKLHVVVTGSPQQEIGNRLFVEALGAPFDYIPFRDYGNIDNDASYDAQRRHLFPWERKSRIQRHVSSRLAEIVASVTPDAIVIDYVPSVLFARPLLEGNIPCLVITLNNEDQSFRNLRARVADTEWAGTDQAQVRLQIFEMWVYCQAASVAVFRDSDIQPYAVDRRKYHVVSPVFPKPEPRWSYDGNRTIFFVGNHGHYPNRMAIDWLCREIAPRIALADPTIQIRIIGTTVAEETAYAALANVEFLGYADRNIVIHEFTHCGLFIAPIFINYGCEIKLQECLSYATPFVTTQVALDGLPLLPFIPVIDQDHPDMAVTIIQSLLDSSQQLVDLSSKIETCMETERLAQKSIWGGIIGKMIAEWRES